MTVKKIVAVTSLILAPAMTLASGNCNTTMKQAQAYGALSLDCAIGFFDKNSLNNTRRACAVLTLPNGKGTVNASTEPYSTDQKSDFELRDKACFDAAMKYAKMPQ